MIFFNKTKQPNSKKTFTSGIIIFAIIVVLLVLQFFYPSSSRIQLSKDDPQTRFKKLVEKESSFINDSLPHYEFKRKQDSIRNQLFDEIIPSEGDSFGAFDLGVEKLKTKRGIEKYYLMVKGYFARDFLDFYQLHGKNYVEYDIHTKTNDPEVQSVETKKIETNLKLEQLDDPREWQISYPVSKTAYTIWQAIMILLAIIAFGFLFYGIIFLPLRLLFLIAKGKAFSDEVIGILYTIAFLLIFAGIFRSIFRLILHLCFKTQLPYPFTFYYYDDVICGWGAIVTGFAVLLLAKAFRHGYELQQEQELTV